MEIGEKDELVNAIYVELDTILDTRFSLLHSIDDKLAMGSLVSGKYFNRITDTFGYISNDVWREIYRRRNENVLLKPIPTKIQWLVKNYVKEADFNRFVEGTGEAVKIYLNIYPYVLSEEKKEKLRMGLMNSMPVNVEVVFVNWSIMDITPEWVDENVSTMVMYDGLTWLGYWKDDGDIFRRSVPDTLLLTPRLMSGISPMDRNSEINFFNNIKESLSMFIDINFLDVDMFCLVQSGEKKK